MATAKESLRIKVDQLSEEEARVVLGLIAAKLPEPDPGITPPMSRELVRERLAGKPAFRVPPDGTPPFRQRKRLQCQGIPASELLIRDRR